MGRNSIEAFTEYYMYISGAEMLHWYTVLSVGLMLTIRNALRLSMLFRPLEKALHANEKHSSNLQCQLSSAMTF